MVKVFKQVVIYEFIEVHISEELKELIGNGGLICSEYPMLGSRNEYSIQDAIDWAQDEEIEDEPEELWEEIRELAESLKNNSEDFFYIA